MRCPNYNFRNNLICLIGFVGNEDYCLTVWYHNYGKGNGELNIVKVYADSGGEYLTKLESGEDEWKSVLIDLTSTPVAYEVCLKSFINLVLYVCIQLMYEINFIKELSVAIALGNV